MKILVRCTGTLIIMVMLGFALCQGKGLTATSMTTATNDGNEVTKNVVDSRPQQNKNCTVDDPFPSNSEGDAMESCLEGQRRGSAENPCLNGHECCLCSLGSYQPNKTTCDWCIPHTICDELAVVGDSFRDNVCKAVTVPDTVLSRRPSTIEPTTIENYTVPPSRPKKFTPTLKDTGQDKKFSIPWPWSVVVVLAVTIIAMVLLFVLTAFAIRWHRKHTRRYNQAPGHDVQLDEMGNNNGAATSPPKPPENIPTTAGATSMDCAIET